MRVGLVCGMEHVTILTDASFDEIVRSDDRPVLVEFTAEWCGPCKQLAPVLDEIAVEQAESLRVAAIDVDENPQITLRYGVMSMPTMILFKDGEPERRIVGARGKHNLLEHFAGVL
jgi:thioredoxin 1